jgi:hypothetical protein
MLTLQFDFLKERNLASTYCFNLLGHAGLVVNICNPSTWETEAGGS